jgi:hypothetical protein
MIEQERLLIQYFATRGIADNWPVHDLYWQVICFNAAVRKGIVYG